MMQVNKTIIKYIYDDKLAKILSGKTRGPGFNPWQILIFSLSHLVYASLPVYRHKYFIMRTENLVIFQ